MSKFLVLDDGETRSELLERHLSEHHASQFVSTIEQAVTALNQDKFDLVLVNIHRRNETIFSLLQEVQDKLAEVPFICLRGPDAPPLAGFDDAYFMALMIAGARGYVTCKDYSLVCSKLEEFLPCTPEAKEALIA